MNLIFNMSNLNAFVHKVKVSSKFAFVFALVFILTLFAGCSDKNANQSGSAGNISSEPSSSSSSSGYSYSDSDDVYASLSLGLAENGYFADIHASDYVALPEYKGISVPSSVMQADEEEYQAQVSGILESYASSEKIYSGTVADGDTVNIDYTGRIDGVAFDGGSTNGAGATVTIGVDQFIDDMLPRLVGHSVGETFELEALFPEDYRSEDLRGKQSVFEITINYIVGEETIPEALTAAMAVDCGFETIAELEEDIKAWIVSNQQAEYLSQLFSDVSVENIPDSVMDHIITEDLSYYQYYADMYGMELDAFIEAYSGYETKEDYITSNYSIYTSSAAYYLLMQAIAEQENLEATDEDIAKYGYESYLADYSPEYIKMHILQENIVPEFIFDNAVVLN